MLYAVRSLFVIFGKETMNNIPRREFMKLAGMGAAVWGLSQRVLAAPAGGLVLVEAENFQQLGGWVLDQEFMDQMGSPYLLAHGLGEPVADATTTVTLPAPGTYRVWVRTCDWVAKWQAPGAPGKFLVLLNGKPLKTVFGTAGAAWHWQDGGTVTMSEKITLALRDLTGFEGRCDAILFSQDVNFLPPHDGAELAVLRRQLLGLSEQLDDGGSYELVVVGGGVAGVCAALTAARSGLKVALVHNRPVVGGNNSSEIRVNLAGKTGQAPFPNIGNVVNELGNKRQAPPGPENKAENFDDALRMKLLRAESNLHLLLWQQLVATEVNDGRIVAIVAQDVRTGRRIRVTGELFADCTGDGQLGFLAGADFEVTRKQHMGPSNIWQLRDAGGPVAFPRCIWALDLSGKPFPGRAVRGEKPLPADLTKLGQWYWETGFDLDPITEVEAMRDWNFRAMYGAWDSLKNVDGEFPHHQLEWATYLAGKRESRRLLGDVLLTAEEIVGQRIFEDACFPCTWDLDRHYPDLRYAKGFEGREFISEAHFGKFKPPYWAPYRCLYSRNIPNLFMAGRDISVTHDALGTVRVMRTCGMMGEVVGLAATLCRQHGVLPRGVYEKHLAKLTAALGKGAPSKVAFGAAC
ncbi:MAG: FAD-dependent oxidoreductase [Verrucomicrobia bacterium]|nr:MAG: FAD-dependent oxidoreductase [Verrucomicrobiota bacterium]